MVCIHKFGYVLNEQSKIDRFIMFDLGLNFIEETWKHDSLFSEWKYLLLHGAVTGLDEILVIGETLDDFLQCGNFFFYFDTWNLNGIYTLLWTATKWLWCGNLLVNGNFCAGCASSMWFI